MLLRMDYFKKGILYPFADPIGKLSKHTYERYTKSFLSVNFSSGVFPSHTTRAVLNKIAGYDPKKLFLLRSIVARIEENPLEFQTGYVIYGPPGSGKSTFVNLCMAIAGKAALSVTSRQMTNPFARAELKDKNLLVFSVRKCIFARRGVYKQRQPGLF